jgi:carbohydrate kinase (thermoresistant glucokinase family)
MIEGDDMHSNVARQKMGSHIPLTDADRLSWLAHIRGAAMDRLRTTRAPGVLITCSALRSIYRQELRALQELAGVRTVFIMLETDSREELKTRLTERRGHYMAPAMVDAQVDLLESAGDDEIDVVPVNSRQAMDEVVKDCQSIVTAVIEN